MPVRLTMLTALAFAVLAPAHAQSQAPAADAGDANPASNGMVSTPSANLSAHALCDAHANALFEALGGADYTAASSDFEPSLRTRYSPEKLKQDYEALPASYGKMLGRGRPHTGDMAGHTVVMAPLIFERGTVTAEVHCAGDGAVSDLRLKPTQVMSKP
ncbi:MAG: hypothetical protein ACREPX_03715 [Rhodanobacteraceae bacterium]